MVKGLCFINIQYLMYLTLLTIKQEPEVVCCKQTIHLKKKGSDTMHCQQETKFVNVATHD